MEQMVLFASTAFLGAWLIFLSIVVFSIRSHYNKLLAAIDKKRIDEILAQLVNSNNKLRIGVTHFRPFEKSGGDQSFVLALLDKQENGVVLNFMYTPEGLRVYPKSVKQGGTNHELTEEEKKAIEVAS